MEPAVTLPRPWRDADLACLAGVAGVLTDIDDTLTRDGAIEAPALAALHALAGAGIPVIAITGRPAGWSEPFALAWPVAAIVAENGAVALWRQADALHRAFVQDAPTRAANAGRLHAVAARILAEIPGTTLARDSAGRLTDIAIDHAEFARLDDAAIERVAALMRSAGMQATVSSIHINGWFGSHDKLSGARWILQARLQRDFDAECGRWVYVGDSTNDQLMFGHCPLSVGVANLREFAAQLHTWPSFITEGERGAGFAEVAERLLAARGAMTALRQQA
jgi:hypothetical protein